MNDVHTFYGFLVVGWICVIALIVLDKGQKK